MATKGFPSLEEIAAINDIIKALDTLEEHEIDYIGLETLEELKERLVLEWNRRHHYHHKADVSFYRLCRLCCFASVNALTWFPLFAVAFAASVSRNISFLSVYQVECKYLVLLELQYSLHPWLFFPDLFVSFPGSDLIF